MPLGWEVEAPPAQPHSAAPRCPCRVLRVVVVVIVILLIGVTLGHIVT